MTLDDHLSGELASELRARAADVHATPLSFDGVRGRARSIRRRRHGAAAGAAAAVVAAVLVVPALLSGSGVSRSERPQPAPAPPAPSGPAVLHGGTITLPDGTRRDLGLGADVSELGVLRDGRLVLANQRRSRIEVYAAGGGLTATYPVDLVTLVMGPTDEVAAWTEGSRVMVLESGHAEPVALARMPASAGTVPMVDAVTGTHCAGGGCRAVLSDGTETTSTVSTEGVRELPAGRPMRVTDVSPDGRTWAVAFPPRSEQQYPCAGLYDVASATVTARTCATDDLEFSPDGRHLVGAFFENNMAAGAVTVVDRRLRAVLAYAPAHRAVVRVAWADPTHLLAAVVRVSGQRWSLVRVDIGTGASTTLQGPAAGGNPEMTSEYLFSQ